MWLLLLQVRHSLSNSDPDIHHAAARHWPYFAGGPFLSCCHGVITGESVYVIEAFMDSKGSGKSLRYLVKWEGYAADKNTWEPAAQLKRDMTAGESSVNPV